MGAGENRIRAPWRQSVYANLRWGLSQMSFLMIVFGLLALLPFAINGKAAGEGFFSLPQLLLSYLITAILGGIVLGILRPIGTSMAGAALIGALIGAIAAISFHIATQGFTHWEADDFFFLTAFSLAGVPGGMWTLHRIRQTDKSRRLRKSKDAHVKATGDGYPL